MTTYVALVRGVGPENPNMRSEKFKDFFAFLGFTNVHTVISSGNIVFDSPSKNPAALEKQIETALPKKLGFTRAVIIRSRGELERLVKKNPFEGVADERPNYLVTTFFKDRRNEICTAIDMSLGKTPQFMADIEKRHGKALTTRTWKTVHRILKKMESR